MTSVGPDPSTRGTCRTRGAIPRQTWWPLLSRAGRIVGGLTPGTRDCLQTTVVIQGRVLATQGLAWVTLGQTLCAEALTHVLTSGPLQLLLPLIQGLT